MFCGAFNGAVAVFLGLPSIVTSLFLMFIFGGAQLLLMERVGSSAINLNFSIKPTDRMTYTIIVVAALVVITLLTSYFFIIPNWENMPEQLVQMKWHPHRPVSIL